MVAREEQTDLVDREVLVELLQIVMEQLNLLEEMVHFQVVTQEVEEEVQEEVLQVEIQAELQQVQRPLQMEDPEEMEERCLEQVDRHQLVVQVEEEEPEEVEAVVPKLEEMDSMDR
jgi:hypothetical protein